MRAQMNAGKAGETEKHPMLERLLQYHYSPSQPMPDHDIISECIGHLWVGFRDDLKHWLSIYLFRMAGTDTTSTSITYLFWELSRRPDIMKKLQAELDEVMTDSKVLPDISVLQELPYLSAFMKEGESSLWNQLFASFSKVGFLFRPSTVHCCSKSSWTCGTCVDIQEWSIWWNLRYDGLRSSSRDDCRNAGMVYASRTFRFSISWYIFAWALARDLIHSGSTFDDGGPYDTFWDRLESLRRSESRSSNAEGHCGFLCEELWC